MSWFTNTECFKVNGQLYEADRQAGMQYWLDEFEADMDQGTSRWIYEENPSIQAQLGEMVVWVHSQDLPYTILAEIDKNRGLIWFFRATEKDNW